MYMTRRLWEISRGLIHKYGSEVLKKRRWNRDYSRGMYGYGCSAGDLLYSYLVDPRPQGQHARPWLRRGQDRERT
jgi:hypothetical protein